MDRLLQQVAFFFFFWKGGAIVTRATTVGWLESRRRQRGTKSHDALTWAEDLGRRTRGSETSVGPPAEAPPACAPSANERLRNDDELFGMAGTETDCHAPLDRVTVTHTPRKRLGVSCNKRPETRLVKERDTLGGTHSPTSFDASRVYKPSDLPSDQNSKC